MSHCTAVALQVAQFDDGSSLAHVPAVVDVMQYGVCPSIWLHFVHTLTPLVEEEHVAQAVVAPHVASAPVPVMQSPEEHAEHPALPLPVPHVAQPDVSPSGVGHICDPVFQQ